VDEEPSVAEAFCGVSDFDWNRSPSLVELSQPLSQNRHTAIATKTRPALAPIGAFPRRQASASARPRRKRATLRCETGAAKLADDG
jgi:hypothetical protein